MSYAEDAAKDSDQASDEGNSSLGESYAEVAAKGLGQTAEEAAAPQPSAVTIDGATSFTHSITVLDNDVNPIVQPEKQNPSDPGSANIDAGGDGQGKTEHDSNTDSKADGSSGTVPGWVSVEEQDGTDKGQTKGGISPEQKPGSKADSDNGAAVNKASCSYSPIFSWADVSGDNKGIAAANLLAIVAASSWLGYRASGLHERGELGWRAAGLGLGIAGAIGALEGLIIKYLANSKRSGQ